MLFTCSHSSQQSPKLLKSGGKGVPSASLDVRASSDVNLSTYNSCPPVCNVIPSSNKVISTSQSVNASSIVNVALQQPVKTYIPSEKYSKNASTQTLFGVSDHVVQTSTQKPLVTKETQTTSKCDKVNEFILSVNQMSNPLPVIDIFLAKLNFPFLVDSGSSICIIDADFFHSIKSFIKYKFLARAVTISTINSDVKFSGCVDISFKINSLHFKHNFFLVNMPNKASFKGILGTDFLRKESLVVNFNSNTVKVRELEIPFINSSNISQEVNCVVEETDVENKFCQNTYSQKKISKGQNVQKEKVSLSNSNNKKSYNKLNKAKLCKKTIIPPNEQMYVKVYTVNNINVADEFLFEPNVNNKNLKVNVSLHALPMVADNNTVDDKADTHVNDDTHTNRIVHSNTRNFKFHILIENLTEKPVHLNKNTVVGECSIFDDVQKVGKSRQEQNMQHINLIQADKEIRQLREQEFNVKNFKIGHLSNNEHKIFEKLLSDYKQVFATSLKAMGHTDLVTPKLTFTSDYPRRSPPFPIPQKLLSHTKEQLDEMLEAGIISKTISDWSSPLLLVKKKLDPDGQQRYRLALDLRLINTIITQSAYPLPKIADIINNISQYKFYSNLDLQSAYHQINLPEEYRPILSFNTPFGAFCYNRLVFGLKNSASIFQHLIDKIIDELNIPGIMAYQDDIVVGANSFEESIQKLSKLFDSFKKYNLTLSSAKCNFHNTSIDYLGFNISKNIVKPVTQNITKITNFPIPDTKRKLKKLLGLCGFYRHLVPRFAELTAELNDLTTPKANFNLTEKHRKAIQSLQEIFFKEPFLRQPDWQETFYLNTDASSVAISACLLQKFGNDLLPVSYFSKTLNKHEKNYPAIKLELMAIVKGVQAFKYYLFNRNFIVLSDSQPLKHYKSISSPTDLTTRWLLALSEYNFSFEHISGHKNVLADYFSRIPEELSKNDIVSHPELLNTNEILPVEELTSKHEYACNHVTVTNLKDPLLEISTDTFLKEQLRDPELTNIYKNIQQQKEHIAQQDYVISSLNNLLYKYVKDNNSQNAISSSPRLVVPKALIPKVLRITHMGHLGVAKTYALLRERYFWKGAYKDTKQFVESCVICLQAKPQKTPQAPFQGTFIPRHPGEMVSMDIIGPFHNKLHILTIIDIFTRHMELYPLINITAATVAEKLVKYISTHGRPSQVLCDLGTQFTATIFQCLNNVLHINLMHTSVAHPQANGISERINTSIKSTIKALQLEGYSFMHAIDLHKAIYNASKHPATGFSPNNIHFARDLSLFTDTLDLAKAPQNKTAEFKLFQILEAIENVYRLVYHNLEVSQEYNKARQKASKKMRIFKTGDIIYIKAVPAFKQKLDGPFHIVKPTGPVNYLVQRVGNPNYRKFIIHADRLVLSRPRPDRLVEKCSSNISKTMPLTNSESFQETDSTFPLGNFPVAYSAREASIQPSEPSSPSPSFSFPVARTDDDIDNTVVITCQSAGGKQSCSPSEIPVGTPESSSGEMPILIPFNSMDPIYRATDDHHTTPPELERVTNSSPTLHAHSAPETREVRVHPATSSLEKQLVLSGRPQSEHQQPQDGSKYNLRPHRRK